MKSRKVFCLGFQKTGSSSMGLALAKLGYSVESYHPFRDLAKKEDVSWDEITERALKIVQDVNAVQDTPWPLLYRELDENFPESKFILVIRDRESWLDSAIKDFGHYPNAIHTLIYGCPHPIGHEQTWLARYDQHNREVQNYFANRPNDFLSLDLSKGEVNWANLCNFLEEPIPRVAWPHANTHKVKRIKMKYYKLKDKLRFNSS